MDFAVFLFFNVLFFCLQGGMRDSVLSISQDALWPGSAFKDLEFVLSGPLRFYVLSSFLLAPAFFSKSRICRWMAFISSYLFVAFNGHSRHIWVLTSFWFCLYVPSRKSSSRGHYYGDVMALVGARFQWTMVYLLAGLHKLHFLFFQEREVPWSESISYLLAGEYFRFGDRPILADVFLESPFFNILGLWGAIFIQCGMFFVLLKNSLGAQVIVGVLALLFHMATSLFLGVHFSTVFFAIFILYLFEPLWVFIESVIVARVNIAPFKSTF